MREVCIEPNEIHEGDLLAYAENADAAPQRVRDHVARCPACAAQVEVLRKTDRALQTVFAQELCPTSDALLGYVLDVLSPEEHRDVTCHIAACPRCAADVRILQEANAERDFSVPDVPESDRPIPDFWQQVARFARVLIEAVSISPRPELLPALRGRPHPMQLFRARGLDIALLSERSASGDASTLGEDSDQHPPPPSMLAEVSDQHPPPSSTLGEDSDRHPPPSSTLGEVSDRHPSHERFRLRGRIMQGGTPAPQAVGHAAYLVQDDCVIITQTVDDLGYFVFDDIPPGAYDILLEQADADIMIRDMLVGNDEPKP